MKPLRIALIRQRYTAFGGAERFVERAVQALQGQGAQLTLITRSWDAKVERAHLTCNPFYLGNLWRDWGFARCVCRALKHQTFDLVQSHERLACCDVFRAGDGVHREWLSQRKRAMGLFGKFGINLNPYHHYVMTAEKKMFHSPQLKAVICNSKMVKEEIQRYFGLDDAKLHVIYSGVDTEAYHPRLKLAHRESIRTQYQIPQEAPLFLFVGSGFERKGLPVLLQAMKQLPENAHLLVVGKDKKLTSLKAQSDSMGLSSRIHFAGGQQDVKPYYGAADVFVLPTLYDPFPNVALEAMASGLPVITSFKSGAAELINHGKNGFVCDALDLPQLVSHMQQLMSHELQITTGTAARETMADRNLDTMGTQLLELYKTLLPT